MGGAGVVGRMAFPFLTLPQDDDVRRDQRHRKLDWPLAWILHLLDF